MSQIINLISIKHRILAIGRGSGQTQTGGEAARTVGRLIGELETLNRSTERDFLAVGEKLMSFRSSALQIASDMAVVIELISGEHGREASHALSRMLDHSKQIDARIGQSTQALARVQDLAGRMQSSFSGLPNMVSMFQTLCTLTRIETSRLGGAGADLSHLTAEVRPLSESIQSSGAGVIEITLLLGQEIQAAIRSSSELQNTQLKEMAALISGVIGSLGSFEERRKLALESSDLQAAQYAAVCEAINDLVGSIQLHDITRQQVEHVIESLRQFRITAENPDGGMSASGARTILTLQSSQLADAARVFAASIERIEHDLESIAARLESATETVSALMGVSGNEQSSFFLEMESQFSAILNVLGACTAAQAKVDSTAAGLEETIGRMRASVGEIRVTEIRIQRISTNATIRACHLGSAGGALNKIAEEMQRLAQESNTTTEEVALTLDEMSTAAGYEGPGHPGLEAESMTNQVANEMRHALGELHSSSESSFSRVNHIAALSSQLAADIAVVRGGFSAGRVFAEVVARVRCELQEVGAHAEGALLEEPGIAASEHLEHLAKTYTMQSQHDVHQSIVAGTGMPVAVAQTISKAPPAEGDLGENVDLF